MAEEFNPDWCVAPAVQLREWMTEHGMPLGTLVAMSVDARTCDDVRELGRTLARAGRQINRVLHKGPLDEATAALLTRGTGIPARMWLALEHNYRAGLAAGLKDVTPDG